MKSSPPHGRWQKCLLVCVCVCVRTCFQLKFAIFPWNQDSIHSGVLGFCSNISIHFDFTIATEFPPVLLKAKAKYGEHIRLWDISVSMCGCVCECVCKYVALQLEVNGFGLDFSWYGEGEWEEVSIIVSLWLPLRSASLQNLNSFWRKMFQSVVTSYGCLSLCLSIHIGVMDLFCFTIDSSAIWKWVKTYLFERERRRFFWNKKEAELRFSVEKPCWIEFFYRKMLLNSVFLKKILAELEL